MFLGDAFLVDGLPIDRLSETRSRLLWIAGHPTKMCD